jgi:hypothetical protein
MTDRPIRVLLNATSIGAARAGAANYILSLAGALVGMPEDLTLELLAQRRDREDVRELAPGARVETTGVELRPLRIAWEHLVLPRRIRRIAPELVHGPHYTLPGGLRCPSVVTFHDPTFFTMPEVHERTKVAYFTRMARSESDATRVMRLRVRASRASEHGSADPTTSTCPLGGSRAVPSGHETRARRTSGRSGGAA